MGSKLLTAAIHPSAGCPPIDRRKPTRRLPGVASLGVTALETTEEFTQRMTAAIDGASLTLLLSIGHQTGLLDTMAGLEPSTSEQIASAAGLNERYVREWLAGMTTGRVVEYDADTVSYSLPAERAKVLTREAGPDNLALVTLLF